MTAPAIPTGWAQRAEARLLAAGHRRGGARRALLELLAEQECALSALEIEQQLRARAGAGAGRGAGGERAGGRGVVARGERAGGLGSSRRAPRAVSRASVYRILEQLEGLGLVQRVETGQAMVRYERVSEGEEHHHHHLVCDDCGVVMPFSDPGLERAIATLSARDRLPLAVVSEHEIVLHGSCERCAA